MSSGSLNHWYIGARQIVVSIQHLDYQVILADMCILIDGFCLHNVHFGHKNPHHKPFDKHDSIDRKLHRRDNLHCTDKYHVHMISMDFLVYPLDKYNLLYGFVLSNQLHGHSSFHHEYMD